jgi:hypothetical protein
MTSWYRIDVQTTLGAWVARGGSQDRDTALARAYIVAQESAVRVVEMQGDMVVKVVLEIVPQVAVGRVRE